jgi:hypothetical protein
MTNTNKAHAHFAPTGLGLDLLNGTLDRTIEIPSAEAMRWDGAGAGTNCTITSTAHGIACYAELKIATRTQWRRHKGGVWGLAAQVRFTGTDDDTTEWSSCVVFRVAS